MPNAIQILTTLEYLGPYSTGTYFGLVLQVGVAETPAAAQDVRIDSSITPLLQPWRWSSISTAQPFPDIQLWKYAKDKSSAPIKAGDAVPFDLSRYTLDATIQTRLEKDCDLSDLAWTDSVAVGKSTGLTGTRKTYPWPAHLAQVARYPYPIPHLLNLSFLIKVTDVSFVPATSDFAYFATVSFKTTFNKVVSTYIPKLPSTIQPGGARIVIPYNDTNVFTSTEPLNARSPITQKVTSLAPAASTLSSASLSAETNDWQAHLVAGTADIFDLSARLLGAVRKACTDQSPSNDETTLKTQVAANFGSYLTAFIAAQRDIVSYGCQNGPDGRSLLRRVCNRWISEASSDGEDRRKFSDAFIQAVAAQRTTERANPVLFYDNWIFALAQVPGFAANPLIAAPSSVQRFDQTATYKGGDSVVFHSRLFSARQISTGSVPGSAGSAANWMCLTPTLSIYDGATTYHPGENVLYGDAVYNPVLAGGNPAKLSPPIPPQSPAQWVRADISIDPAHLSDRLIALEHLQLAFTQPDLLAALLLWQWKSVGSANNQLFQSLLSSAASSLGVLDIRGLLLQGNLQDSWPIIVAPTPAAKPGDSPMPADRDSLRRNLTNELLDPGAGRMQSLLTSLPGVAVPLNFGPPLLTLLASWLKGRMVTLIPGQLSIASRAGRRATPATSAIAPQVTRISEGVSVLLDTLDAASDSAADASDSLRQMSGLCVLMREATSKNATKPWRCLDVGIPMTIVPSDPGKPPNRPTAAVNGLGGPTVVPVPQHTQDSLRRAILTYNNQPLMAQSPAHGFSNGLVPKPSGVKDRLISFQHPSVTLGLDATPQWKIPGLAFNRTYDFLIGRVSNAGALPREFADKQLGPAVFSFDTVKVVNPPVSMGSIPYNRTVPVADLRFGFDNPVGADKVKLPAIPADVHPRAREALDFYAAQSAGRPTSNDSSLERSAPPLIMLTPYQVQSAVAITTYKLAVRKPTTDLLTWDRWKAALDQSGPGPSSIRQERTDIWTHFHQLARQESTQNNLALDDPAVLSLSITAYSDGIPVTIKNPQKPWLSATGDLPPNMLQNAGVPLVVTVTTSTAAKAVTVDSDTPEGWTLTLPPGAVARVVLTPVVDPTHENFFSPGILTNPDKTSKLQPYTFLAETANSALPSAKDLIAAFNIAPTMTPQATNVDFTLTAPDKAAASYALWRQVRGADLQAQAWRWDGRPSRQFPFKSAVSIDYAKNSVPKQDTNPSLLKWELEAFSTRLASDATIRPMARAKADAGTGTISFESHDDLGKGATATYYRAGVTVYNRYGSLVPDNPSSSDQQGTRSQSTLGKFASIPGADGGWTRRFVPARVILDSAIPGGYQPPRPAIKFIVPLTGTSDNTQAAAASVLIVVQGPWYSVAGLAEDMNVSITQSTPVIDPNNRAHKLGPFTEAGPDPLVFKGPRSYLPAAYTKYGLVHPTEDDLNPRFHGPIGHTFDSSDANPLWVTSSFVLDPPTSDKGAAQEGTFVRVQFSRSIHKEGIVVDNKGVLTASAIDYESDATDPVWVQFLPSRFLAYPQSFDQLNLFYDGNHTVSIRCGKTPISLSHALNSKSSHAADSAHVIFALLLTEEVPDLLGRKGQERFVDVLLQPAADSVAASWQFPQPKGVNLIGRIVVIQRQVDVTSSSVGKDACRLDSDPKDRRPLCNLSSVADLWDEMFPGNIDQDAVSRIIAVSPPVFTVRSPSISRIGLLSCAVDAGGQQ
jgi:hypothetical protein